MDEDLKSFFAEIIENNTQKILRICRAYSNNKENQKDLLQDVALNIWETLASFRQEEVADDTWVYRI